MSCILQDDTIMSEQVTLKRDQLNMLTHFIWKHQIHEIELNQAESRYFFSEIDKSSEFDSSRIFLQPIIAEAKMRDRTRDMHGDLVIKIIQRHKILQTDEIVFDDGFEPDGKTHFNPFTRRFIEIFIEKMSLSLLLDKLAENLAFRFPISQGQAKAVMIKHLGITMSSGTRSFLHDLRVKIRKYQELVDNFQEYVMLPSDQERFSPYIFADELISRHSTGELVKSLKHVVQETRETGQESRTKELLKGQKAIVKGKELPKLEKRFFEQDNPKFEFVCLNCDERIQVDTKQLEDDERFIQPPKHHGKEMTLKLVR